MILIIQNGKIPPSIQRYLDRPYKIVKSYEEDVSQLDCLIYSLIIILGGNQSALDSEPELMNVIKLIQKYHGIVPILGICLGLHLISRSLDLPLSTSTRLNQGYDSGLFGIESIFRCHKDWVSIEPNDDLPDNITIIEWLDSMPNYIQFGPKCIGIQCHPDITPEAVESFSGSYRNMNYAKTHHKIINTNNKIILDKLIDILTK